MSAPDREPHKAPQPDKTERESPSQTGRRQGKTRPRRWPTSNLPKPTTPPPHNNLTIKYVNTIAFTIEKPTRVAVFDRTQFGVQREKAGTEYGPEESGWGRLQSESSSTTMWIIPEQHYLSPSLQGLTLQDDLQSDPAEPNFTSKGITSSQSRLPSSTLRIMACLSEASPPFKILVTPSLRSIQDSDAWITAKASPK